MEAADYNTRDRWAKPLSLEIERSDDYIRRLRDRRANGKRRTVQQGLCIITTMTGAEAALLGIESQKKKSLSVCPLQTYNADVS